ncbi:MAG: YqgE/AlgH family protein [Acidiferrobacterales bacterium]
MSFRAILFSTVLLGLGVNPVVNGDVRLASIPGQRDSTPPQSVVPEKGVFLVAKRGMPDPRFQRTVVLLLAHSDQGTLGLIINRPTEILLSRVLPDLKAPASKQHALFFGGPVGMDMLLFLTRSGAPPERTRHVMADVYYSADRDTLEQLLETQKGSSELRMYIGHSGWAPGQLASEIARGDWLLVHGDSNTIFKSDLKTIWPKLIDKAPPPGMIIDNGELPPAMTVMRPSFRGLLN